MTARLFALPLLCSLFFLSGCSRKQSVTVPAQQFVNGMVITLASPAPHMGDNTISIMLADSGSTPPSPIGNANITAIAEMISPRLPGSEISGRAQGNGLYNIPLRLGIATRYKLTLHIARPGRTQTTVIFPLEAAE